MTISPLSPFIFYATDTNAFNQYNVRSVMPIPENMPKKVFVVGETYTFFVEDTTEPIVSCGLSHTATITEPLTDWWRIDITFNEQGHCDNLLLNYVLVCYEFDVMTYLPKNIRNPFIKIEYSHFENDFGNIFVTSGVKEYFHFWLQVNNISDLIKSDKSEYTDDNSISVIRRSTVNDGISISAVVDGQTSKMLNYVFACKYCRINGIGYTTSEDFDSKQTIERNGIYEVSMDLYRSSEEYTRTTLGGDFGFDAPLSFGIL